MKRKIQKLVLAAGWILLIIFLTSTYYINRMTAPTDLPIFKPIAWTDPIHILNGAVQCHFMDEALDARKRKLTEEILSKVQRREEAEQSITYYFKDEPMLLASALEHVQIEKSCCPFFQFDISILPFSRGFALRLSGSEEAMAMVKEFENGSF